MTPTPKADYWRARCPAILEAAAEEARRLKHSYVGVEHLINAITRQPGGPGEMLLQSVRLDPGVVRNSLRTESGAGKQEATGFPELTPRLRNVLMLAEQRSGSGAVLSDAQVLRAIFEEGDSLPVRYLASLGHDPATFRARLDQWGSMNSPDTTRLGEDMQFPNQTLISSHQQPCFPSSTVGPSPPAMAGPSIAPQTQVPQSMPTPTLDEWGRDLSKLARLGRISEAIGREAEIEQLITILARTQKSNPLLLGEAGVGKTAVVEGLAWQIANGQVPPVLRGRRIVEIEMGGLTAGTSLRGQFEERVKNVISEATNAPEVILFIDEIHTIVGAGKGEGASDAAQMFKPALARGDVSCIGATTNDEYARYLRKDPALERRFSPVTLKEMEPRATLEVLQKVAPRIVEKQAAKGQALILAPDTLWAAVTLTDKYVRDRHQPDKSIDAVDIACARAVVKGHTRVTAADIAHVVSEWTGIPATRLSSDEMERYYGMESVLNQRVIGQAQGVAVICRSVRTALAGMKAPNRPIGVFLFVGPSGVGKTKLAKELAAFIFGTSEALTRFDMNEYQEKHSINNLIGSPRGYVGSEQGGQLTEALRRRPYSVVLLDEIEKGHADVFNLFLSVFDDGRITDNSGRVVDCSNAIFIMTSNISERAERPVGYNVSEQSDLRALAGQFLRPELVNRITEIVRFAPLGRNELSQILDQLLSEKMEGFRAARNITVNIDESAKDIVLGADLDPRMGARPLERAVDQLIVQPLVDAIFSGKITRGEATVTAPAGKIVISSGTEGI
jgi:ATP-dependent Clp protease ATP-binding subunit ClpC